MTYDEKAIVSSIEKAMKKMDLTDEKAHDIAFHMTDWLEDLAKLQKYYEAPEKLSSDEASDLLMKFLLHVPNHIAAAMKLISDFPVTDIFEVGAVSEN